MPQVVIKYDGMEQAKAAVNSLADQIKNPDQQLMRRIGDATLEDLDQRFMTRGYGTWAPLSAATIARKGNDMVLIDTGAMYASSKVEIAGPAVRVTVPYGGVNHNTSVPAYHQQGTRRMPQRKIVEFTPQLRLNLIDAMVTWLVDMLKAKSKAM